MRIKRTARWEWLSRRHKEFLNTLRKEQIPVSVLLAIGIRPVGYIESFNELRAEANSASCTADSSGTLLAHRKSNIF